MKFVHDEEVSKWIRWLVSICVAEWTSARCTAGAASFSPAIPRTGRLPAHEFICYSDPLPRLVMAGNSLTATNIATKVSTNERLGGLVDRVNTLPWLLRSVYISRSRIRLRFDSMNAQPIGPLRLTTVCE